MLKKSKFAIEKDLIFFQKAKFIFYMAYFSV